MPQSNGSSNVPKRSTTDLSAIDTDLAEWTSRIKAMQAQVDADEEDEQRKLEEEIAASRLARLRRSHGAASANRLLNSELVKDEDRKPLDDTPNRQIDRRDVSKPASPSSNLGIATRALNKPTSTPAPPPPRKSEPMSLAAFMGGKATGPRLNKHAPQQDAHDPTQFVQRTAVTAPHPVFGRNGVAMPGMLKEPVPPIAANHALFGKSTPEISTVSMEPQRKRTTSIPSAPRPSEKSEPEAVVSSSLKRDKEKESMSRDRTLSSPSTSPVKTSASPKLRESVGDYFTRPTSQPPPKPPAWLKPSPSALQQTSPSAPSRTSPATTPSLARPVRPDTKPSPPPPKTDVFRSNALPSSRLPPQKDLTPSLSRLKGRGFVQSMVKVSSRLEAAASSPAQDRSPPPTGHKSNVFERFQPSDSPAVKPSLAGSTYAVPMRKSRTSDSSALANGSQPTSSGDRRTPRRKSLPEADVALLDTRNARSSPYQAQSREMTPPSKNDVRRASRRKSLPEAGDVRLESQRSEPPSHAHSRDGRKSPFSTSQSDHSSGRHTPRRKSITRAEEVPGLGSSQTLISYIKPTKTGDDPLTSQPDPEAEIDELGFRLHPTANLEQRSSNSKASVTESSSKPPSIGMPLSHPTKDRARRPKRAGMPKESDSGTVHVRDSGLSTSEASAFLAPRNAEFALPEFTVPRTTSPLPAMSSRSSDATGPVKRIVGPSDDALFRDDTNQSKPPLSGVIGHIGKSLPGMAAATSLLPPKLSPKRQSPEPAERRALPGLTTTLPPLTQAVQPEERSPSRHTRIPSTGNRATVMEVAEALHSHHGADSTVTPPSISLPEGTPAAKAATSATSPKSRPNTASVAQAERRKSNYEKYSAIILPPLREETTPTPSPVATLARGVDSAARGQSSRDVVIQLSAPPGPSFRRIDNLLHFVHGDEPIPRVEIDGLIGPTTAKLSPDANSVVISVDILSIAGGTASPLKTDANVFYDTEILAIVHRYKSTSNHLVSTRVWGWQGRRCTFSQREDQKLRDLARHHGTSPEIVRQYYEPPLFVFDLGGRLATRQGTRAHWSSENTTMHSVRSKQELIYIQEHDFSVRNLCSGYSFCASILGSVYVWHGCGSLEQERHAAMTYARELLGTNGKAMELKENEASEDDELFWMMFGDDNYAKADYWQWRPQSKWEPQILKIDTNSPEPVRILPSFQDLNKSQSFVLILDCIWEFFVLVGARGRNKRKDIRCAIDVATRLSKRVAESRPYTPNVHVLVLPSRLPLEFCMHFRDAESEFGDETMPDHMNLLSCPEAQEHLNKSDWEIQALKDRTMLPLGLDPSDLL